MLDIPLVYRRIVDFYRNGIYATVSEGTPSKYIVIIFRRNF